MATELWSVLRELREFTVVSADSNREATALVEADDFRGAWIRCEAEPRILPFNNTVPYQPKTLNVEKLGTIQTIMPAGEILALTRGHTTNKLYQIVACDADGNDKSLMTVAADPKAAFAEWEHYYYPDAQDERNNGYQPHAYDGEMQLVTDKNDYQAEDTDWRAFEVDFDLTKPGALEWWNGVNPVAYIPENI